MFKDKVNILGEEWQIINETNQEKCVNNDANGLCEWCERKILLDDWEETNNTINNPVEYKKKTLRHEIIHAFLFESGLAHNSEWATNEEMVDYFAIQFPKMVKAMIESGCIDG